MASLSGHPLFNEIPDHVGDDSLSSWPSPYGIPYIVMAGLSGYLKISGMTGELLTI